MIVNMTYGVKPVLKLFGPKQSFYFILLIVFMLTSSIAAIAQGEEGRRGSRIIDDSTRQIYGPTTSRYFYEKDVFFNQTKLYPIDTLIRNFHRFSYVERTNYMYQDLGNVGTPARPVFYEVPEYIGATSGFEAFDLYWEAPRIRYFDTKSPYANMALVLGKGGRSLTDVTFSRNINPRWNFGFDYRGIFVDKQIQRRGKGDRHVRSTYYDLFTTYYTKDSSYRLFVNFARNMYQVDESGGVRQTSPSSYDELFMLNARPLLTEAESRELRIRFHLFHQYEVGRGLQVYHTMDRYRQGNQFFDFPQRESYTFDAVIIPGDTTSDRATIRSFRNEAGIKGNISKIFYNGYYAIRHYSMHYKYFYEDTLSIATPYKANENYLGGRIALQLDSLMTLEGWAEILLDRGNYRIEGTLKSRWLEASLKQNLYTPPFIHQAYRGSHDLWVNSFDNTEVTQLNGYVHYRTKSAVLSPGLTFTRLRNYTFFDHIPQPADTLQQVLPVQTSGNQIIASPEVKLSMTFFKHITLSSQVIYTKAIENAGDAIRVPELFINSQLSYANIFFNGNLDMHAGVDFHWQSEYKAPAYDPVTQQFFTQDFYTVPAFPIVDLFFSAKIKRGRVFLKYHNILQKFQPHGYIPTPYYPGQRNVVDFGFDWSFYD